MEKRNNKKRSEEKKIQVGIKLGKKSIGDTELQDDLKKLDNALKNADDSLNDIDNSLKKLF